MAALVAGLHALLTAALQPGDDADGRNKSNKSGHDARGADLPQPLHIPCGTAPTTSAQASAKHENAPRRVARGHSLDWIYDVRCGLIEGIVAQREHEDVVVRIEALIRRPGSGRKAGERAQLDILVLCARNRPSQFPVVESLP